MKVLIADDARAVRKMIALMVQELRPYVDEVLEAEDAAGVKRAGAAAGRELAVAVADWDLPGMSGSEIGDALREICGRDVAVLVCINPGQQADVTTAGPIAVRDSVVRPFSQDELRRKVLALLTQTPEAVAEASAVLRTIAAVPSADTGLPFFLQLPSAIMKDFLELATAARHPAGTILLSSGRKVDALHVVSSGTAEVVKPDGSAGDAIDAGNCFGELSFMSGEAAPFSVRARTKVEVISLDRTRLAELLRRQPQMSQYLSLLVARRRPAPSSSGMGGNLRSMPFSDLVQMMHTTGKSGSLQFEGKEGRGSIAFVDGSVVHAQLGEAMGEEAFFLLSAWTQGMFFFKAGDKAPLTSIAQPTMSLLMEAMRRLDEGGRPAAGPPAGESSLEDLFGNKPA